MASLDDDWRLQGQEAYLDGVTLKWSKYRRPSDEWDHDHCEFCGAKFTENGTSVNEAQQFGYTTNDKYRWICMTCFDDFNGKFKWTLAKQSPNESDGAQQS